MTSNVQHYATAALSTQQVSSPLAAMVDTVVSLEYQHQFYATVSSTMSTWSASFTPVPSASSTINSTAHPNVITITKFVTVPAASPTAISTSPETRTTSSSTLQSTYQTSPFLSISTSPTRISPLFSLGITATTTQTSTSGSPTPSFTTAYLSAGHETLLGSAPRQTNAPSGGAAGLSDSSRKAIVGGLAGAIAGFLITGFLLCLFLRRRQRRQERQEAEYYAGEKGSEPSTFIESVEPGLNQTWSGLARDVNRSTPELPQPRTPSPADGSLIRVSTEHWLRPYVAGGGLRESLAPAPLRITNPDGSTTNTPALPTRPSFFRQHSAALAAMFLGGSSHASPYVSTPRSGLGPTSKPPPLTSFTSSKVGVAGLQTPSFNINSSKTSLAIVVQQPPDDPFLTSDTQVTPRKHRLQSLANASERINQQLFSKSPFQEPPTMSPRTGMANPNVPDPTAFSAGRSIERSSVLSSDYDGSRKTTPQTINTARWRASDPFDLVSSPSGPWDEMGSSPHESDRQTKPT
jgi:hypothetical protein